MVLRMPRTVQTLTKLASELTALEGSMSFRREDNPYPALQSTMASPERKNSTSAHTNPVNLVGTQPK